MVEVDAVYSQELTQCVISALCLSFTVKHGEFFFTNSLDPVVVRHGLTLPHLDGGSRVVSMVLPG